jgi:hypothetical protein
MMVTLHETYCTFKTKTHSIFLKMRNVLGKSCKEYQTTGFMFSNFFSENRAFYYMWKK